MPEAINPAEALIDTEFPSIYRPLVPAALKRAYASARAAYGRLEFLSTPSGKFHRGDLVVLAAEFEFVRLVRTGKLPFDVSWEDYAAPTGKHLVLKSPGANITVNQVTSPHKKPRWAQFRDDLSVPSSEYLFPDWNEELREDRAKKHILLLHGHGMLRFCNLAVPHPTDNRLVWWTEDLLSIPHVAGTDGPGEGPMESPDAEIVEEVVREVHDRQ